MPEIFSESIVQLIIYFAVLAIITGVAIYVSGLFRANSLQNEPATEEHLDYFRELNLEGKLSKEEFRIIKKQLSMKIVEEEKNKTGKVLQEDSIDPAVLLARLRESGIVFMENRDDTQRAGGGSDGNTDDTAVHRQE